MIVLFNDQGVVKLRDFGLSRLLEGPEMQADSFVDVSLPRTCRYQLTRQTRGYLAPVNDPCPSNREL